MPEFEEWVARADRNAAVGTVQRIYADSYFGFFSIASGKRTEDHTYLRPAVERARQLGDEVAYLTADPSQ